MSFQLEIDKAIKEKRLYFVGDSLPIDWYAGFKLWLILAQNGDVKAQYNVGRCYDRGDGVEQDAEKAKYWYLKAAESQDPRAFNNLFSYYSNENSNEINLEIAENYLNKAIELGEPRAIAYSAKRIADNILKEKNNKIQKENEFRIECQKKLAEFFAQNDFIEARKLILIAEQANIYWAKNLTSYLDLQFSHEIENNYTKKYENTNTVINGTTSYLQVNTTSFFAVVIIKNPTPHKLKIRLNYSELNIDQNSTLAERIYSSGVIDYFTPVLEEQPDIKFRPRFEIKLPEKIIIPESRISYGKDSFCFVLTACYGDENHPVVVDFRNFRDIYLNKFYLGRKLTVMYYHFGPKAARFISNKSYIKNNLIIIFDAIRKILPKTTSK